MQNRNRHVVVILVVRCPEVIVVVTAMRCDEWIALSLFKQLLAFQ